MKSSKPVTARDGEAERVTPKQVAKPIISQIIVEPAKAHYQRKPGKLAIVLIQVDHSGKEVPGTEFSVSEKLYNKTYAGRKDFAVKKNTQ